MDSSVWVVTAFQKLAFPRKLSSLQTGNMSFSTSPLNGRVASCTDRELPDTLTGKLDS